MIFPSVKIWVYLVLVCLGAGAGHAATWYAAANGSSTNGTIALPWSVQYSVTNTNPHLQSGDTVLFKNGTYVCTETNVAQQTGAVLEFRKSGTPSAKITYQAETLWGFAFDGGLLFPSSVSNLVIRNCHIFYSGSTNRERYSIYTHPSGINTLALGVEVLHNLIENTGHPGIGSWKTTHGKYIAGNIVRFTGNQDHTPGQEDGQRGAGMYLQNADDSAEALIQGNLSYYNNTEGMQAYGNTDIWGFRFANNIITSNTQGGILYHQDNYGSRGVTVNSNYMWNNTVAGIRIGYPLGNGGHTNAVVSGNYIVDTAFPFYQSDGWTNCIWTNNIGINPYRRQLWSLEVAGETSGDVTSHTIDHNTYATVNYYDTSPYPFQIKAISYTFTNWQAETHGDTNSTSTIGLPTNVVSYVFAPSTDPNFVHVAVFNWPTNRTTTVDLSAYFPSGARLAIYDAQAIPNAYTNLTFGGSTVTLDLTRTNRAEMLGTFTQRTNKWSGFDQRFRAFVIYHHGNPPEGPNNLRVVQ